MPATTSASGLPTTAMRVLQDLETGVHRTDEERVGAFRQLTEYVKLPTMVPLLPLILNLSGQPYTLRDYAPFESVFQTFLPHQLLMMTARQVAKSTSQAARAICISNSVSHFSTLFVTPLYEQVRRFSTQYVRPFIDQSPVKSLWTGTNTENSVLQRTFKNYSRMFFSFALTDADRVRGISAHMCCYDEIQDMDHTLIPIIRETMSASKWRLSMYTGTPKTLDNTIQRLWEKSSRAEWGTPCLRCKKLNIASTDQDLYRMIGPYREDIGPGNPATICASPKCGKPIDPRNGRWYHADKEKKFTFPGYHLPQVVMPLHYEDRQRWLELLGKQQGSGNTSVGQFHNEVLGTSYDVGTKLITKTELKAAALLPWRNNPKDPREALAHKGGYALRVLGVDWGGGGEDEVSFTTAAVLGYRGDGRIDILYGRRLLTPQDHLAEAQELLRIWNMFDCQLFSHDYNGAGSLRETFMVQAGLPLDRVVPMVYFATASKNLLNFHKSDHIHSRNYWQLDKARSLLLLCNCLKLRWVRSFQYDYENEDNPGLLHDFLALQENKIEMARGRDVYTVVRNPAFTDDFAHSVNFGCAAIWQRTQNWPDLATLAGLHTQVVHTVEDLPTEFWD